MKLNNRSNMAAVILLTVTFTGANCFSSHDKSLNIVSVKSSEFLGKYHTDRGAAVNIQYKKMRDSNGIEDRILTLRAVSGINLAQGNEVGSLLVDGAPMNISIINYPRPGQDTKSMIVVPEPVLFITVSPELKRQICAANALQLQFKVNNEVHTIAFKGGEISEIQSFFCHR